MAPKQLAGVAFSAPSRHMLCHFSHTTLFLLVTNLCQSDHCRSFERQDGEAGIRTQDPRTGTKSCDHSTQDPEKCHCKHACCHSQEQKGTEGACQGFQGPSRGGGASQETASSQSYHCKAGPDREQATKGHFYHCALALI